MYRLFNDVLPSYLLNAVINHWPSRERADIWHYYNTAAQRKFSSKVDADKLGQPFAAALHEMAYRVEYSNVDFGEAFPDFSLYAAGLMRMRSGDFIAPHTDAACHPFLDLIRVASTVLYLTGGILQIADSTIEALPNSMIVFDPGLRHEVKPVENGDRLTLNLFWWRKMSDDERATRKCLSSSSNFGIGETQ